MLGNIRIALAVIAVLFSITSVVLLTMETEEDNNTMKKNL